MSIIDTRSIDTYTQHHHCGGTILGGPDHAYCDNCDAVVYYGDDEDCQTWDEAVQVLRDA